MLPDQDSIKPEILPTVTLGITACKKPISTIDHKCPQMIIRVRLGGGGGGGWAAIRGQKITVAKIEPALQKVVHSYEDDDADERHPCDCFLG